MKKITLIIISFFIVMFPLTCNAVVLTSSSRDLNVYLFSDIECKECQEIKEYFKEKNKENERIILTEINVREKKKIYSDVREILKFKKDKYPIIVIGSNYFFDFNTKKLDKAIESYLKNDEYCDLVYRIESNLDTKDCLNINKEIYKESLSPIKIVIIVLCSLGIVFCLIKMFSLYKKMIGDSNSKRKLNNNEIKEKKKSKKQS